MSSYLHSKSRLFLLELVLAFFLFAVSASICIQVFVKAYTVSRDADVLTQAVRMAENASAMIDAAVKEGRMPCFYLLQEYPDAREADGVFTAWFDASLASCRETAAVYALEIVWGTEASGLEQADISLRRFSDSKAVHTLCKQYHLPNTP